MSITPVDGIRIMKYLKSNPIGEIYYLDLCDALGKRNKISNVEFLEYFVEAVIKEFKKDDKISIKLVSKLVVTVESFLEWVHEAGTEVDEVLLDKIRSFEEYYDEYLNRTNNDIDLEFTDRYLASLLNNVNEWYPHEEKSESVIQYLNEIESLKNELLGLKREYDSLTNLYNLLQKKYDKRQEDFSKKSDDFSHAIQAKENCEKEISSLNETIFSLNKKIEELEAALANSNLENIELSEFKTKFEFVVEELKSVKSELQKRKKEDEQAVIQFNTDSIIESLIYQKLLFDGLNINQLLDFINKSGYSLDRNQVYNLLNRMKSKINIENGTFSLSPTYKIVTPKVNENGVFDIGLIPGTKRYDILLVSDYHLREMNEKIITGTNMIYDYCACHDINLVLNLGDFFDHIDGCSNLESATANYRLAESVISLLPKGTGVYQAILGGNHDRRVLKYGFDHIELIAREREDFINLGYKHATVTLNGSKSVLNSFDLHHPSGMSFDLGLGNEGIDSDNILGYLNDLYGEIGRSRDDSFVDLFGHTHKSQYNFMDSYCFIPSFFEGKNRKGACHLRIYLDEETQIKYMIFMPLSITDKFTKQTEIVYQKMFTR